MNKVDLIQALKNSNNLSKSEAERIVALFFDKMADALAQGERVEIRRERNFKGYFRTVDEFLSQRKGHDQYVICSNILENKNCRSNL
jgi:integration host factor subunit beta